MNRQEKVYAFLQHQATVPLSLSEIAAMLAVPPEDFGALVNILEELVRHGRLSFHRGRYAAKKEVSDEAVLSGILAAHSFPPRFPEEAEREADKVPTSVQSTRGRLDLRSLLTFTIDNEDAKDFDDAISIEETEAGYRLYVHIADVSHYVKRGSALDREAFARGTSCYLPGRAVPMLPLALSHGICSLNPGVDRLTLTTIMELGKDGHLLSFSVHEAVIRSDFRLVYSEVSAALARGYADEKHAKVFPSLVLLDALCTRLSLRQKEKGSIDFNIPEPEIVFDAHGRATDIKKREDGRAGRMIENAMVLCNRTIAEYISHLGAPFIYRVHEAPDKEKRTQLSMSLSTLSLTIPGKFSGKKLAALLEGEMGSEREHVVSTLLLRAMMKARYSHENMGHFGLALDYYCHFTSPIRRYPDLVCHRIVKTVLHGEDTDKLAGFTRRAALFSSEREEAAVEAEREAVRFLMCRVMEPYVGQEFTAVVSSVTDFGLFVELPNLAEGLVHVRDMGDDYYIFDEKTLSLTGKHSGQAYRLGQTVRVELVKVDSMLSRMDFVLKEALADGKNNRTE